MRRDAGVEDRDVRVDPFIQTVDLRHRREVRADAPDAGRDSLCRREQLQFGLDELDARVLAQPVQAFFGNFVRESIQRMRENVVRFQAMGAGHVRGPVTVLENDHVTAGDRIRLEFFPGRMDSRGEDEREHRREQRPV